MATRVAPAPRERESEAFSRLAARLEDVGACAAGESVVGFIFEKYGVGQAQGDLKAAEGKVDEIAAFAKAIGPGSASVFFAKAYWNPETLTDSRILSPRTAEFVKGFGNGPGASIRVGDYFEAISRTKAVGELTSEEVFGRAPEIQALGRDAAFSLFMELGKKRSGRRVPPQ